MKEKSILLGFNGYQYNITGAVADYFLKRQFKVHKLMNPLFPHHRGIRKIESSDKSHVTTRTYNTFLSPPFSYFLDFFFPLKLPISSIMIGFNPLITLRFLLSNILRKGIVIHWNIDFSPRRFKNSFLNTIYNFLDRQCCKHSDIHVDITMQALNERYNRYKLPKHNSIIIPVGVWVHSIVKCNALNWKLRELLFIGNLSDNQGILELLSSMKLLTDKSFDFKLHIIGQGPMLEEVKQFLDLNPDLARSVLLYGELSEENFAAIAKKCCLAFALYPKIKNTFSAYSDSSKIKNYLSFGLPIIMSVIPTNSAMLESLKIARIVDVESNAIAIEVENMLTNFDLWKSYSDNAFRYIQTFDWNIQLDTLLYTINRSKN